MSEEIRVNRVSSQVPRPEQPTSSAVESKAAAAKPSKMPWLMLIVVVVVLAGLAVLFRGKLFLNKGADESAVSGYQAVFLTNGQVYFGKISGTDREYVTLKDIYYLQVGPQQGSGAATSTEQSVSLVKLGQELHGPVDEMHISRSQILFYEDLKPEGNVVKAIKSYQANPQGGSGVPNK